ncbi:hypothetical protein BDR26DRAFT_877377 [Obelidium mucronatum]|nr:hypothetical protein BDR26DRAFT_877377 [Obelidium mucronatum]
MPIIDASFPFSEPSRHSGEYAQSLASNTSIIEKLEESLPALSLINQKLVHRNSQKAKDSANLRKSSDLCHLPNELITHIFLRVPHRQVFKTFELQIQQSLSQEHNSELDSVFLQGPESFQIAYAKTALSGKQTIKCQGFCHPIPHSLFLVTSLVSITLSGFVNPISPEIKSLAHLQRLELSGNKLGGVIPDEIEYLQNLTYLNLSHCELSGCIPDGIGNLAKSMDSGPIPIQLGNLVNLENLVLSGNNLTGPVPKELGNLNRLMYLHLFRNRLSGNIPIELLEVNDGVKCVGFAFPGFALVTFYWQS